MKHRSNIIVAALLSTALATPVHAQMVVPLLLKGRAVAVGGYTGPGDLKTYVMWYGSYALSAVKRGTNAYNICNFANSACVDAVSDASTGIVANPSPGGVVCGISEGVDVCSVKSQYDQTGNGWTATQNSLTNRATWLPNCGGLSAGIACLVSNTNTWYATANVTQAQPLTATFVARRNASTSAGTTIIGTGVKVGAGFFGANNDAYCYAGNGLDVTASDATWHGVGCAINDTSSNITVDVTNTAGTTGTTGISAEPVTLFNNNVQTEPYQGRVASVGIAAGAFTTTELAAANAASKTILGY